MSLQIFNFSNLNILKKKIFRFGFLIILFNPIFCKSQKTIVNENSLFFYETKSNQPFFVKNDTLFYKGFNLRKTKIFYKDIPDRIQNYNQIFHFDKKTFFVHKGCGVVLELKNDSIIRIDNSFLHQNQFGAFTFDYKNEIYFFGGYGLFTHKNILTKYSFNSKEWLEVSYNSEEIPSPRNCMFGVVIKDNLYIFGGYTKEKSSSKPIDDNKIWCLNLEKLTWSSIGTYNKEDIENGKIFTAENKIYSIGPQIAQIDLINNRISYFPNKNNRPPFSIYYNPTEKKVSYLLEYENGKAVLFNESIDKFLGKKISEKDFISDSFISNWIFTIKILIYGLLALIVFICIKKYILPILLPFEGIIYSKEENLFYYKGKIIDIFEINEINLLSYFANNLDVFIPLSDLNRIFENKNNKETYSTVLKRRDNALSGLILKLNIITGKNESDFLESKKNDEDKRIKEVKFISRLLKVK